jgi:hypothetical protein
MVPAKVTTTLFRMALKAMVFRISRLKEVRVKPLGHRNTVPESTAYASLKAMANTLTRGIRQDKLAKVNRI